MLYDPKWEKPEVKADPFKLESLIAWLEKQPAAATYNYTHSSECLVAQYLQDNGVAKFDLTPLEVDGLGWDYIAAGRSGLTCSECEQEVWSFGAALERAREQLVCTSAPALSRDI